MASYAASGGKPMPKTAQTPNPRQPQLKQRVAEEAPVTPKQAQTINMMETAKQNLRKPAVRPATGGGAGSVVGGPLKPTNAQGGTGAGGGAGLGPAPAIRPQPAVSKPAVQPPPGGGGTPTINFEGGQRQIDTSTIPLYASNPGATMNSGGMERQALYDMLPPRMRETAMAAGRDPQEAIASRMANDPNFARVMAARGAQGAPGGPPAAPPAPMRPSPPAGRNQQPINLEGQLQPAGMGPRGPLGGMPDPGTMEGAAGGGFNPRSLSDLYQQLMPARQPKLYGGRASYGVGGPFSPTGPGSLA